MAYRLRDTAAALKLVPTGGWKMRDDNGILRTIKEGRVRDTGGVLRLFYAQMIVQLSSYDWTEQQGVFSFPHTVTTANTFAMGVTAGGVAPFSYLWVRASGSSAITATTPAAATTQFTSNFSGGASRTAYFYGQVTDADGQVATSFPFLKMTIAALDWT